MVVLLPLLRLVVFGATSLFAIIVLGLGADVVSLTVEGIFTFAAMGIAVAILTLLTLPAMIAIDFLRRGALTSMVLVELIWTLILWVLWLAAAGLAADQLQFDFGVGNTCNFGNSIDTAACNDFSAITAFGFLAWLSLLGYNITLFIYAIIGANRGHRSWFSTVGNGVLGPDPSQNTAPAFDKQIPLSTGGASSNTAPSTFQYPPQQQYQGQPMTAQV